MEISYDHNSTKILLLSQMYLNIKIQNIYQVENKPELTKLF